MLEILIYLYDNYISISQEWRENLDIDSITDELEEAGFPANDINKAFSWLETIALLQSCGNAETHNKAQTFRVFTAQEIRRLSTEARSFLHLLEQSNLPSMTNRELIIDGALGLETSDVDLDQIKWVAKMILISEKNQDTLNPWIEELFSINAKDETFH